MEIDFKKTPPEEIIQSNPDGSRFIPINLLEDHLDCLHWSTQNFHHTIFKNGYADLVVAASLELVVLINKEERSFVGTCSFSLKSIEPNPHFLATAKSECIKNAATDIGVYFGRHLNDDLPPAEKSSVEAKLRKLNPDAKIMQQFLKAVEDKDEATITMLSNIYEIKNA